MPAIRGSFPVIALMLALSAFALSVLALPEPARAQAGPASQATSRAASQPVAGAVSMGEVRSGALLLKTDAPGAYVPAPTLGAEIEIEVTDRLVRAHVTHHFYNPSDRWVEGLYAFPLPTDAAVDGLRLRIGDRLIEGRIKEKQEAREIYERARAEGRRASLVEQQRPNLFTNEVANIGPGESVAVRISYQDMVRVRDGRWQLRVPTVVAPRFNPPLSTLTLVSGEGGTGDGPEAGIRARARDLDAITSPLASPDSGHVIPVMLTADLAPGFEIAGLGSPSHEIEISRGPRDRRATVGLGAGAPADRDFVLEWRPADAGEVAPALFARRDGETAHILLSLTPPPLDSETAAATRATPPRDLILARDLILVQDVSGSMGGESIRQARAALEVALDSLRPEDRLGIVTFSHEAAVWRSALSPATDETLAAARRFVSGLEAGGGTMMLPAIQRALAMSAAAGAEEPADAPAGGRDTPRRLRQLLLVTDGAIGNEDEIFRAIDSRLGSARLFTVGIGSAPNSFFMSRAAEMGRGSFTHIGEVGRVAERMGDLLTRMSQPALTDIEITWPEGLTALEPTPNPVPDLYRGEPLMVAARGRLAAEAELAGAIEIAGRRGETPWRQRLDLAAAERRGEIGKLWARRKIREIEARHRRGALTAEERRMKLLDLALGYGLVSDVTSLVAVDITPARPEGARLTRREIAQMLPEGWDWAILHGLELPAPERIALPGRWDAVTDIRAVREAAAARQGADGLDLPQTATPARLKLLAGFAALALAGALFLGRARHGRRRRTAAG